MDAPPLAGQEHKLFGRINPEACHPLLFSARGEAFRRGDFLVPTHNRRENSLRSPPGILIILAHSSGWIDCFIRDRNLSLANSL